MDIKNIIILQEKILQKLSDDAILLEAEKYNDGVSSSNQTYDSEKNISNILSIQKQNAELDKIKARDNYRNLKTNPNTSEKIIKLAKQNYSKAVTEYKKADLKKSNFKYANSISEDFDENELIAEFDNDLLEASTKDIEFANIEIERLNKKIDDVKEKSNNQKSDLNNENKNEQNELKQEKSDELHNLEDALNKKKEQVEDVNNKKMAQLEKNKEMSLKRLERRLEKLKFAKDNIKANLSNSENKNNEDIPMNEEYQEYLDEKEQLEEGIVNAFRKMKLHRKEKKLDKIQNKLAKLDIKLAELREKNKKAFSEKRQEELAKKIERLEIKRSELELLQKHTGDEYNEVQSKINEDILFESVDMELLEADNLIKELDKDVKKMEEAKYSLLTPEIKRIIETNEVDPFIKPVIDKIKEEISKENPDKKIIKMLIIKYAQMKK